MKTKGSLADYRFEYIFLKKVSRASLILALVVIIVMTLMSFDSASISIPVIFILSLSIHWRIMAEGDRNIAAKFYDVDIGSRKEKKNKEQSRF